MVGFTDFPREICTNFTDFPRETKINVHWNRGQKMTDFGKISRKWNF